MPRYNVTHHLHDQGAPTIRKIVATAIDNNLEAVSLVREPTADRQAGIAIFLLGPKPMRKIGPMLLAKARELGDHAPNIKMKIMPDDSLKFLFQWMEGVPLGWCYDSKIIDGRGVTLIAFLGTDICRKLSVDLNNAGVPTSLK